MLWKKNLMNLKREQITKKGVVERYEKDDDDNDGISCSWSMYQSKGS